MKHISKFLSTFHIELQDISIKDAIEDYKKELTKELNKHSKITNQNEILQKINQLSKHHPQTIIHSLMVGKDVKHICTKLEFSEHESNSLILAAYLHDIGKLNINNLILTLKGRNELEKIWNANRKTDCPIRTLQLMNMITIQEVINYKASIKENSQEFLDEFRIWSQQNNLNQDYLNLTIMQYIKLHQKFTKKILQRFNLDTDIIEYASTHHSWYYNKIKQKQIPKKSIILEIVDRFNAIAQTEGIRTYTRRKSKIEALIIIIEEILYSYNIKKTLIFKTQILEKQTIYALIQKYFPQEINNYLKPKIEEITKKLSSNNLNLSSSSKMHLFTETIKMINIINAIVKIDSLFNNIKLNHYAKHKNYKQHIIYLKSQNKQLKILAKHFKKNIKEINHFSKSKYLKSI